MFILRDLPDHEALQMLAEWIPQADPASIRSCLVTLRVASDLLDAIEHNLTKRGMSQGRFVVLMLLRRQPEHRGTPSMLADKAGVTRATMTGLLDGLEREGLIRREQASVDRRNVNIHLTKEGCAFLEEMLPSHFSLIAGVMQHLNDAEKARLVELLAKVQEGIPSNGKE